MDLKIVNFIILAMVAGLSACGSGNSAQDPLVDEFHIAYVKRPFPLRDSENNNEIIQPDARDPLMFYPGSELFIRDHATAQAAERNLTIDVTNGAGDVKDVEVSYDGKKLLFALKKPDIEGLQPEEQPTWNIWEYNIETDKLRRVIELDVFSEEGHDVAPYYLPDGRIVFSSTRQYGSKETLANEGKPFYTSLVDQEGQHAMMLHVMNSDGTEIRQITFAPAVDMDPFVHSDGRIIFTRWDRFFGRDSINLYAVNPDGTNLQLLYGAHSHDSGPNGATIQYTQARELPDGRILSIIRPYAGTFGGGDIGLIEADYFADYGQPTKDNIGLPGTGQSSLTDDEASAEIKPALGGRFISVYPLWDGTDRSLVSWTPCRLVENEQNVPCTETRLANPDLVEAEPVYNLYVLNHANKTKLPIVLPQSGTAITDVVAAQVRAYPEVIEDTVMSSDQKTGILHIRSVYDFDGTFNARGSTVLVPQTKPIPDTPAAGFSFSVAVPQSSAQLAEDGRSNSPEVERTARFLRLIKPFVRPEQDELNIPNIVFGRNPGRDGMMEIIGYAPIEPDGSVKVRVPADVPFSFQIVNKFGRRIGEQRHMSWLQVRKGEILECNGCHNHNSGIPHGRRDAIQAENTGAPQDGPFPAQTTDILAHQNETMAETRIRLSCANDDCAGLNPTVDIIYQDIWTKPVSDTDGNPLIIKGEPFSYLYSDIFNFNDDIVDPVSKSCVNKWTEKCRMVINYVTHIDPIWSKLRLQPDGVTELSCSQNGCHSPVAADGISPQVPLPVDASQLNLDNNSSFDQSDDPNRLEAYRELFFGDNRQELDMNGLLADILVPTQQFNEDGSPVLDMNGDPVFVDLPEAISGQFVPLMISGSANGSSRFFSALENDSPVAEPPAIPDPANMFDHTDVLSPAELRLISEWLDIGAQYYNDPFAVPN